MDGGPRASIDDLLDRALRGGNPEHPAVRTPADEALGPDSGEPDDGDDDLLGGVDNSGEIRRLEAAGSTKRFDGDISHHQHVRCIYCGRIGDVEDVKQAPTVEGMHAMGFASILNSRVEYDGVCEICSKSLEITQ